MNSLTIADTKETMREQQFPQFVAMLAKSYDWVQVPHELRLSVDSDDTQSEDAQTIADMYSLVCSKYRGMNWRYMLQAWKIGLTKIEPGFPRFAGPQIIHCIESGRYDVHIEPQKENLLESPQAIRDREAKAKYEAWRSLPIDEQIESMLPVFRNAADAFFRSKRSNNSMGGLAVVQIMGNHLSHLWPKMAEMCGGSQEIKSDSIQAWREECAGIFHMDIERLRHYTDKQLINKLSDRKQNPHKFEPTPPEVWAKILLIKKFESWKNESKSQKTP